MLVDMEAGVEHLSRSTTRNSDVMLVVAEPYYKSLETAVRVKEMAAELDIPRAYLVANKVRNQRDIQAMEEFCARRGATIIATIPYDEQVAESSMVPAAPFDHCPNAAGVAALAELATRLQDFG
jgi:CO dehydrogenase maturation factor